MPEHDFKRSKDVVLCPKMSKNMTKFGKVSGKGLSNGKVSGKELSNVSYMHGNDKAMTKKTPSGTQYSFHFHSGDGRPRR